MNREKIKELVHAQCTSYKELAKKLFWCDKKVYRIVSGVQSPKLIDIYDLAIALNVSCVMLCELFMEENNV